MTNMNQPLPMPYGWIQQVDSKSGHDFYVDIKADPPRSIWTHPYDDEQYLDEHPDVRNKVLGSNSFGSDASLSLPSPKALRRHSFNGRPSTPVGVPTPKHKEGFFRKLKTKAIDSMERHNERKRQQMLIEQQQRMYGQTQSPFGNSQYATPQSAYPQPSRPGYGGTGSGMGYHRGMGGMGLPLMGGMAGGLLLGDVIGNDFGNSGNFGGGGDWGGGDMFGGGGGGFGF